MKKTSLACLLAATAPLARAAKAQEAQVGATNFRLTSNCKYRGQGNNPAVQGDFDFYPGCKLAPISAPTRQVSPATSTRAA
jgi:hypothetical protein